MKSSKRQSKTTTKITRKRDKTDKDKQIKIEAETSELSESSESSQLSELLNPESFDFELFDFEAFDFESSEYPSYGEVQKDRDVIAAPTTPTISDLKSYLQTSIDTQAQQWADRNRIAEEERCRFNERAKMHIIKFVHSNLLEATKRNMVTDRGISDRFEMWLFLPHIGKVVLHTPHKNTNLNINVAESCVRVKVNHYICTGVSISIIRSVWAREVCNWINEYLQGTQLIASVCRRGGIDIDRYLVIQKAEPNDPVDFNIADLKVSGMGV